MDEESNNFNKEMEYIRKYKIEAIELRNLITEPKNTVEGFNSKLDAAEESANLKTG